MDRPIDIVNAVLMVPFGDWDGGDWFAYIGSGSRAGDISMNNGSIGLIFRLLYWGSYAGGGWAGGLSQIVHENREKSDKSKVAHLVFMTAAIPWWSTGIRPVLFKGDSVDFYVLDLLDNLLAWRIRFKIKDLLKLGGAHAYFFHSSLVHQEVLDVLACRRNLATCLKRFLMTGRYWRIGRQT